MAMENLVGGRNDHMARSLDICGKDFEFESSMEPGIFSLGKEIFPVA